MLGKLDNKYQVTPLDHISERYLEKELKLLKSDSIIVAK